VFSAHESDHATVIARGVPGVETVVNRLSVRQDEQAEETDDADDAVEDPDEDMEEDAQYAEGDWGDEDAADRVPPRQFDTQTAQAQDLRAEPPPPSA